MLWLTKAESKCTTCYAAKVCQASNTCSLSDAYFIMASLSQDSRHLCFVFFIVCCVFTWILFLFSLSLSGQVLAVLQLNVISSTISTSGFSFIRLCLSRCLSLCVSQQTKVYHTRTPGSLSRKIPTVATLNPFICDWRLNLESIQINLQPSVLYYLFRIF